MSEAADDLWRSALRLGALLCVPVIAAAHLIGGPTGALSGLAGFALVVGNVAGGAYLFSRTHPGDVAMTAAIGLGGYIVKIGLLAAAIIALRPLGVVDGPGLAVGVVVPLIVLLVAQVRIALRRAPLWWVTPRRSRG